MFGLAAARSLMARANVLSSLLGRTARSLLGLAPQAFAPTSNPMPRTRPSPGRGGIRPPRRTTPADAFRDAEPPDDGGSGPRTPAGGDDGPYDQRRLREADTSETRTPQSSNVFSFHYDRATGNLIVSFKANGKNGKKLDTRGPTYTYYDVPIRVFVRMQLAASKGKFVWDELRIRGTIYGHQYRYALVYAEPGEGGAAPYIPRRASQTGFRTRSLAEPGLGKRGFRTSTLPERKSQNQTSGFHPLDWRSTLAHKIKARRGK